MSSKRNFVILRNGSGFNCENILDTISQFGISLRNVRTSIQRSIQRVITQTRFAQASWWKIHSSASLAIRRKNLRVTNCPTGNRPNFYSTYLSVIVVGVKVGVLLYSRANEKKVDNIAVLGKKLTIKVIYLQLFRCSRKFFDLRMGWVYNTFRSMWFWAILTHTIWEGSP